MKTATFTARKNAPAMINVYENGNVVANYTARTFEGAEAMVKRLHGENVEMTIA